MHTLPPKARVLKSRSLRLLGDRYRNPAWPNHMIATVTSTTAYMRSDGRFFIGADTVSGSFDRGDVITVPLDDMPPFVRRIDRIYFIATDAGNQQSLMFKNIDPETAQRVISAVANGKIFEISREPIVDELH